jgi:hypothetical protein
MQIVLKVLFFLFDKEILSKLKFFANRKLVLKSEYYKVKRPLISTF